MGELSRPRNCEAAVETTQKCGRIDALVNNAGVNDKVGLEHGSPEQYVSRSNAIYSTTTTSRTTRAPPEAVARSIVNIASKTAVTGQSGTSGYVAAKGAMLGLTREAAVELPDRIRVNAGLPAEVMTPLIANGSIRFPIRSEAPNDSGEDPARETNDRPRRDRSDGGIPPSAQAAHITGQHIFVDGGYVHLDRALT